MYKPKPGSRESGARDALRTVSNYQSTIADHLSSMTDPPTTSNQGKSFAQRAQTESSKKSNYDVRRQFSRSHGDLSKLRPKSPPISGIPAESCSLRLPHGSVPLNQCSPTSNRQCRQALPSHWMTDQDVDPSIQSSRFAESAGHEALLPPTDPTTGHVWPVPTAIHGLSIGISGPIDFCKPIIRTYPTTPPSEGRLTRPPAVQQVTVKTEWKFSDFEVAQELFRIHQIFALTLERMLASEIWKTYLHDCVPHHNTGEGCVRGISFCRDQLVGDMADALYSTPEDIGVRARLGLLRLYLAASDCLTQYDGSLSRDTSITVRVDHDRRSEALSPLVQASWVPDSISFKDLDATHSLREGQELSIIPQYHCNSAFGSTRYPGNVSYKIESQLTPLSWLSWDDHIGGFKGILPTYSALQRNEHRRNFLSPLSCLRIDVLATVSHENGSSVFYERTVCTRLTFDVLLEDHSSGSIARRSVKHDAANHGPGAGELHSARSSKKRFDVDTHTLPNINHTSRSYSSVNERPGFVFSTAKPGPGVEGPPDLAQHHARLAAKYASMSQLHADAEKHIRIFDSLKHFYEAHAQRQPPNVQKLDAPDYSHPLLANHRSMAQEIDSDPSVRFDVHEHVSRDEYASHHHTHHSTVPRSLGFTGTTVVQAQTLDPRNGDYHSALPPPAIRAVPLQHFKNPDRASIPSNSLQAASSLQPCRSGNNASHVVRTHQAHQGCPTPMTPYSILNVDFQRELGSVGEDGGFPGVAGAMLSGASRPVHANDAAAPNLSEPSNQKRRVRSSRGNESPLELLKEDDDRREITTLEPDLTSDSYYKPSRHGVKTNMHLGVARKGPYLDSDLVGRNGLNNSVLVQGLLSSSDSSTGPVHRPSLEYITVKAGPPKPLPYRLPALPTPPYSLNGDSCAASEDERGKTAWNCKRAHEASKDTYSPYETFYPYERSASVRSSQASSVISHSASSKLEFAVNDQHETIARRQQALAWYRPKSDGCDKVEKPVIDGVQIRLSEDEKRAFNDAIERSLNDIVDDFDGIFISSSDGSTCDDEVKATDEP